MSDARQNAGQKMGQKGAGAKRDQPGAAGEHTNQQPKPHAPDRQPAKPADQVPAHEKHDNA